MPRRPAIPLAGPAAERIARLLPGGDFLRGSVTIAAGTGLAQLIVVLASPILTRIYAPSEFGAYSVALAILAILGVLACLAYEEAIPLPRSDAGAAEVLALCIAIALFVSGGFLILLLLAGPAILELFGAPAEGAYALLIALGVLGSGASLAFLGWAIRMKAYGEIAVNRLTRAGTTAVLQVGLGVLGWGAAGLLVGAVVGILVAAARLGLVAWRRHGEVLRHVTRQGTGRSARRYRRFPLLTAPAMLLNTVGLEAPLFLVVALFGTAVGGQFALAHRVMVAPLTLVSNAIGKTYFAEAARLMRDDPEALRDLFVRTTRSLALITLGPIVLAALLAPYLFGVVFGAAWTEAGVFGMILAPMYYLQLITNPTHGTLVVLERQDLHVQREIGRLVMLGVAFVVAWGLELPPVGAVALISTAGSAIYIWYGLTSWRAIRDHDGPRTGRGSRRRRRADVDAIPEEVDPAER